MYGSDRNMDLVFFFVARRMSLCFFVPRKVGGKPQEKFLFFFTSPADVSFHFPRPFLPPSHTYINITTSPTDVAFKIGSQIMREKVAIGKTL